MEQQVAEAALALVRPTTDSNTRSAASSFLEQWTRTPESWLIYLTWLQSFHGNNALSSEVLGTKLLCLTLLQAKIRRELPLKTDTEDIKRLTEEIRNNLWSLLQVEQHSQLITPLCSCLTSLIIRGNQMRHLIETCSQQEPASKAFQPEISLKILASVPSELESCGYLTTPQVTSEMWPFVEMVLTSIRQALCNSSSALSALECLGRWAQTCRITLSHLNSPIREGNDQLLSVLVQILSQASGCEEELWISASNALTEAILSPTDSCTPNRQAAVSRMIAAISTNGFIVTPFQFCSTNRWDDGAHALANLICTLVSEEVDDLCTEPADSYINLLLQIQAHPHPQVALTVLDCWLAVQDIPTSERHEHWGKALFITISEGLVKRLAYTRNFTTWKEELELDEQEFVEYRRMVTDVLINCYLLLRVQFLQQMSAIISNAASNQDWTMMEAGIFCLTAVFRQVCDGLKGKVKIPSLEKDRRESAQQIIALVENVCGGDPARAAETAAQQHVLVLNAVCQFMGLYAPVWNIHCNGEAILQILTYLYAAMKVSSSSQGDVSTIIKTASKATKSIYISCAAKLLHLGTFDLYLKNSIEAVLSSGNKDAMVFVAEGSTRLLVQIKDSNQLNKLFESILLPLLQRADKSLNDARSSETIVQREMAVNNLTAYLNFLHEVIRFCDTPDETTSPLANYLPSIWSLLQSSAHQFGSFDAILDQVLAVHKQLLTSIPKLVTPSFPEIVKFVVEAYEKSKHPCTLEYLESAIETFSPMNSNDEISFRELLAHITKVTRTYLSTEKHPDACPEVVQGFFEMNQRYILYCPGGLVKCSEFSNIVSMGVECLTACMGEKGSTRAILNFLAQLFGWDSLFLSDSVLETLKSEAISIDKELRGHGESILRTCVSGLVNGPQMLWSSISDCIIAIVMHILGSSASTPVTEGNTIAHEWIYSSLISSKTSSGEPLPAETCKQILMILFQLIQKGAKHKPKAKMLLTDYAKICRGEMSKDSLVSYMLDATEVRP